MPTFKVTIQRSFRIQAPIATRDQRIGIGKAAIIVVRGRIKQAINSDDAPAKPLSTSRAIVKRGRDSWSYAVVKQKKTGRRAVRDWTLSGDMLNSLRVSVATTERIVISPASDQMVKLGHNQSLADMFGISDNDAAKIQQVVDRMYLDMANTMLVLREQLRAVGTMAIVAGAVDPEFYAAHFTK